MGAKVPVGGRGVVFLLLTLMVTIATLAHGQVTWKRSYGGAGLDQGLGVASVAGGGAVICGSTGSFGTGGEAYVFEVDLYGNVVWSSVIGGAGVDVGSDVSVSSDGSVYVVGYTSSQGAGGYDGWLSKLDGTGNVILDRTYGGSEWDLFHAIAESAEGFVLGGSTSSSSADAVSEAWLVRVDANGNEQWSVTLASIPDAEIRDVAIDGSGRIIVVGTTRLGEADQQLLVACSSSEGDWLWVRELGGQGVEVGYGVLVQPNGTVMAIGYTESFANHRQMFLGLIDEEGSVLSAGTVSTAGDDWEARSIAAKTDGDYVMAAYTKEYGAGGKDYYLMTTDPSGNIESGPTFGGGGDDEPWDMAETDDGAFYLVGTTTSYGPGASAIFLVRCVGDTLNGPVVTFFDTVGLTEADGLGSCTLLYPNPAMCGEKVHMRSQGGFGRTLTFRDGTGRVVGSSSLNGDAFIVPSLTAGCYIVSSGDRERYRLIIE